MPAIIIIGIVMTLLGVLGFFCWWGALIIILKALLVLLLIVGGLVLTFLGWEEYLEKREVFKTFENLNEAEEYFNSSSEEKVLGASIKTENIEQTDNNKDSNNPA